MRPLKSLKAITRRELRINYFSPLVCQLLASSSGSGSGIAATLEILPTYRLAGPAELLLEKVSATSVKLTWTTQAYIFSYAVYRATSAVGPFVLVSENIMSNTFTNSGLSVGTYFYKVTGIEPSAGETLPSPVAGPVTLP
jgi:hypothetical protein